MPNELEKLASEAERLPWWAWASAGGLVLGVAVIAHRANQGAVTPIAQADGNLPDGLSPFDLAGLPFGADTGDPGAFQPDTPPAPTQVPVGDPGTPVAGLPPNNGAPGTTPKLPPAPAPAPASSPAPSGAVRVDIGNWPAWNGSLSGIASHYGKSLQAIENFDGNRDMVFAHAHAHGHYGDEWDWVFSGEGEYIEVPTP